MASGIFLAEHQQEEQREAAIKQQAQANITAFVTAMLEERPYELTLPPRLIGDQSEILAAGLQPLINFYNDENIDKLDRCLMVHAIIKQLEPFGITLYRNPLPQLLSTALVETLFLMPNFHRVEVNEMVAPAMCFIWINKADLQQLLTVVEQEADISHLYQNL